jgi:Flp pilus assembly pilin Flp
MLKLRRAVSEFVTDENGQSITEYGAVIAFVGVLIALTFALTRGTLFNALSDSFSSVNGGMGQINSYVSGAST